MRLKGKTLYAYVAGIIDGEGSICLQPNSPKGCYSVRVSVANTNEWLLQMLKSQFGGRIYLKNHGNRFWKPAWEWVVQARKAIEFLQLILPYLQLKHLQAELALSYQKRRIKGHRSEQSRVLDEADRLLMHSYNKRGGTVQ